MAATLVFHGGSRLEVADDIDRVLELAIRSWPHPVALESGEGERVIVNWDQVAYAIERGAPGTAS